MWLACIETSLLVVGGVSAWYILKQRHQNLFRKSLKLALAGLLAAAPLQILVGDVAGLYLFDLQPAKTAAIEAHWDTNPPGQGAEWHVLAWPNKQKQANDWVLSIPNALSLIATHSLDGQVKGLKEFAPADQPPAIGLIFYSFRVMLAAGLAIAALMGVSAWYGWRQRRQPITLALPPWLLKAWVAAIPLGYIATECGWIVREVGRQPWAVYGLLRTAQGVSALSPSAVATSLVLFAGVYTLLLASFLVFARRIIMAGPNIDQPLPVFMPSVNTEQEKG